MKILVLRTKKDSSVALIPNDVKTLVNQKNEVYVQSNAGIKAGYTDKEYLKAGAKIIYKINQENLKNIDLVCVNDLEWNKLYSFLNPNQILWSKGYLVNKPNILYKLLKNNITCICNENINFNGVFKYLLVNEKIKGYYGIFLAANALAKNNKTSVGRMLGSLEKEDDKSNVLILNYSYSGYYATKSALANGANVIYLDDNIESLKEIQNDKAIKGLCDLSNVKLTCLKASFENIAENMTKSQVVITTNQFAVNATALRITNEMIDRMPRGGVLVNLSADTGFACEGETKSNKPNAHHNNISIISYDNIPGMFPNQTSKLFSALNTKWFTAIAKVNNVHELLNNSSELANALVTYRGNLTSKDIADSLELKFTSLREISK